MLLTVLLGGLVGVVLSLRHGALAQKLSHANEIALQVTPASVALGNVITLRGSNFSPHGHIGLTRDTTIPAVDTEGNTIIQADGKGSFADTVIVEAEWQAGSHLIRAEDAIMHKSAIFSAEVGTSPNPTSRSFTLGITSACHGSITITPTVTQNWLTVSPSSAVITGGSTPFTVTVTSASLVIGAYSGAVSIAAVDSKGITIKRSPQTVNVVLTVLAAPSLTVNPALNGLTINVTSGTTSQAININNTGGEPLNWTAALGSGAPSLVSLSASAGRNLVGGASAADNVIVNASGVPGGTSYMTSLTVSAIDPITGNIVAGSPTTIPITIKIAPPAMQFDTSTLAYTTAADVIHRTNR